MTLDDTGRSAVATATEDWLVKAVIGLNLCPFARSVHAGKRVRLFVSSATTNEELLSDLSTELRALHQADPQEIETTLLVHPLVLDDFLDFNVFLAVADDLIVKLALEGVLQIASFHPGYQFADSLVTDIGNYSNRSPYPTLHLLRESSVLRATQSMPDTRVIYEDNLVTLQTLGLEGWLALGLAGSADHRDRSADDAQRQ